MRLRNKAAKAFSISLLLLLTACTGGSADNKSPDAEDFGDLKGCTPVIAAVSPEKVSLFSELAEMFQDSKEASGLKTCAAILPIDASSGEASQLLKDGWLETETLKPRPVIWSPASTTWVDQVAQRTNSSALVPEPTSFARTPVVFAMPESMAKTLGWPDKPISLKDMHDMCLDPQGWGKFGGAKALWGDFKIGKTNPTTSTTGLNVLLTQSYAASGKQADLTEEDIANSAQFSKEFESCVIHYGDTTGNILNRVYENSLNGRPLGYISGVFVEETSLINYNLGNPTSGFVEPDKQLTKPKERLVAVYPTEGSLESDNPLVVLGADWVTDEQRIAANAFRDFVLTDEAQAVLGKYGFRPVDPAATPGGLITPEYGVDPLLPTVRLQQPTAPVATAALSMWEQVRKPSSVMQLMDISNSMNESADAENGGGPSRLEVAKESALDTLDHFRPTDEVGLWVFSTGIGDENGEGVVALRPVSPLIGGRESLEDDIKGIVSQNGTPLFDAISAAHKYMKARAEPGRINAIVVLSDGKDEDSYQVSLDQLLLQLRGSSEGADDAPVRVFPIVYGQSAPSTDLEAIAEASGGQVFEAKDARRLNEVMQKVMRNF